MRKPKVIAIVGPTASGKTALGIYLAQKLNGEVVSADSRQVYKGLDIGTGKVTKQEMAGVPHHMLDVAPPKRQFTADEFVKKAHEIIGGLIYQSTPKLPIIVGGTGFYIDGLVGRASFAPVPPNPALRKALAKKSPAQLLAQLKRLDPRRAAEMDPQNKVRLIRAIEIAKALGKVPTLSTEMRYDVLSLGLNPAEAKLKQNIHRRLIERLNSGMLTEARRLHKKGLSYKRMRELGLEYRFMAEFLEDRTDKAQFEEGLRIAIEHYAKRQMRWFKRNKDIRWVSNKGEALRLAKAFLRD